MLKFLQKGEKMFVERLNELLRETNTTRTALANAVGIQQCGVGRRRAHNRV